MRKSWLKGLSACSLAMPGQSQMITVKQSARGELNGLFGYRGGKKLQ